MHNWPATAEIAECAEKIGLGQDEQDGGYGRKTEQRIQETDVDAGCSILDDRTYEIGVSLMGVIVGYVPVLLNMGALRQFCEYYTII